MNHSKHLVAATLSGVLAMAIGGCAVTRPVKPRVQPTNPFARGGTIPPPEYGSTFKTGNYRSVESDARPGVHFFHYAWVALQKGDVRHAISMYQVSASWAFKPAAYMLGLIYFRGEGVPVDRPLGTAWMRLAAERDTPLFVRARDAMTQMLSKPQRVRSDELWDELRPTYADAHALKKANLRWQLAWHGLTGARAGCHVVGSVKATYGGSLSKAMAQPQAVSADADSACANANPYSPTFLKNPDNPIFQANFGIVTVGPLQKTDKNGTPLKTKQAHPAPPSVHGTKPPPDSQEIPGHD